MNEGPGHVPLHKIPENMRKQLEWCHEAGKGKSQPKKRFFGGKMSRILYRPMGSEETFDMINVHFSRRLSTLWGL